MSKTLYFPAVVVSAYKLLVGIENNKEKGKLEGNIATYSKDY
jgi:hypothetical protein